MKKAMSRTWPHFYCKFFLSNQSLNYVLFHCLSVKGRMPKDFTNLDFWSIDWIQLEKSLIFSLSTKNLFIKNWIIKSPEHLYLCASPRTTVVLWLTEWFKRSPAIKCRFSNLYRFFTQIELISLMRMPIITCRQIFHVVLI